VVIPTYNRVSRLRRVLEALTAQSLDPARFEVVVVSDGSTDGTDDMMGRIQTPYSLEYSVQDNAGPAAARNRGVAQASGQLVVFIDDDVVPGPKLVERHVQGHHDQPDDLVVIGPMLSPSGYPASPYVRWEQAMLYGQYDAMRAGEYAPTYRHFYTGNVSLGRQLILDAGGFNERYRRAEDVELAYRLQLIGARFVFDDRAEGFHYAERPFASWIAIAREYGRNEVIFSREYGTTDRLEGARREFHGRNQITQALCWACVDKPGRLSVLRGAVRGVVEISHRLGWEKVAQMALSGLYNSVYCCGIAEELGGPQPFRTLMGSSR
jgi:glycosyltransferase involved in cell wall biosynthesis